jgi:hypothetical protein
VDFRGELRDPIAAGCKRESYQLTDEQRHDLERRVVDAGPTVRARWDFRS